MPHLLVAITGHGYGHAAMTAPVVNELRRRIPGLRLTLQTTLPDEFLRSRFEGGFERLESEGDFGLAMHSANAVDGAASYRVYEALHSDFPAQVGRAAGRLRAVAPDLVLSNIGYLPIAAAAQAGIPAYGLSSLEWHSMVSRYGEDWPRGAAILDDIRAAYGAAQAILPVAPGLPMDHLGARLQPVGPIARLGRDRRHELIERLGLAADTTLILAGFGGMALPIDFTRWPRVDSWHWIVSDEVARPDMTSFAASEMPFSDLMASCDAIVTKVGYGTFAEAGCLSKPVLYLERPDWPETPYLADWLQRHTQAGSISQADLAEGRLESKLQALFSLPRKAQAHPSGIAEAADILEPALTSPRRLRLQL